MERPVVRAPTGSPPLEQTAATGQTVPRAPLADRVSPARLRSAAMEATAQPEWTAPHPSAMAARAAAAVPVEVEPAASAGVAERAAIAVRTRLGGAVTAGQERRAETPPAVLVAKVARAERLTTPSGAVAGVAATAGTLPVAMAGTVVPVGVALGRGMAAPVAVVAHPIPER